MTKVNVWFEKARGLLKVLQKERYFCVLLQNESGDLFPIYENNNEVSQFGTYKVIIYQPYDEPKTSVAGFVNIRPSDIEVGIFISITPFGDWIAGAPRNWEEELHKRRDRLCLPIGWREEDAIKFLNS